MSKRWYSTLPFRLITTVGLSAGAMIGLLFAIATTTYRHDLTDEVIKGANDISETIKKGTYYDMLEDRRDNVYRTMRAIAEQPDILKLRIFSKEGKITFSTSPGESGTYVDKDAEACFMCHSKGQPLTKLDISERARFYKDRGGNRVLGMVTAIYNETRCYSADCHVHPKDKTILGMIDIDISLKKIDEKLKLSGYRMIVFSAVALAMLSFLVWMLIHRFVINPVNSLINGMKKISSGDLDYSLPEMGHDEIGYLTHSFNKMAEDLQKAKKQIQELINGLEEKVELKTGELKDMQSHLVESEKLASIGRLAAGVAHELNNPLGSILIYNNLTLEDLKEENETRQNVRKAIQETLRARDIIKGLLEFARPKNLETSLDDVNDVVRRTLDLIAGNKAFFGDINLRVSLSKTPLRAFIDKAQIQQVITNLMINSVEAISGKGEISLTTGLTPDEKWIEIAISDTGCGIPEEYLGKLFEPFFTTKKEKGGTGLGLAVSYSIVARHKGKIEVRSEPGKGSTFTIRLPFQKE